MCFSFVPLRESDSWDLKATTVKASIKSWRGSAHWDLVCLWVLFQLLVSLHNGHVWSCVFAYKKKKSIVNTQLHRVSSALASSSCHTAEPSTHQLASDPFNARSVLRTGWTDVEARLVQMFGSSACSMPSDSWLALTGHILRRWK